MYLCTVACNLLVGLRPGSPLQKLSFYCFNEWRRSKIAWIQVISCCRGVGAGPEDLTPHQEEKGATQEGYVPVHPLLKRPLASRHVLLGLRFACVCSMLMACFSLVGIESLSDP
jgi:hypothetical protein